MQIDTKAPETVCWSRHAQGETDFLKTHFAK